MARKPFFEVRNAAGDNPEILLYGEIAPWKQDMTAFHGALKAIGDKPVTVRINSPGGSVTHGFNIFNLLNSHKGEVTARVDGQASSIASMIAMAADKVIMPKQSFMIIHNPLYQNVGGNAAELQKSVDDLKKHEGMMKAAYMDKTGLSETKITKIMDDETLLTADDCVKMGFADELDTSALDAAAFVTTLQVSRDFFPDLADKLPKAESSAEGLSQPDKSKQMSDKDKVLTHTQADVTAAVDSARTDATNTVKGAENKRKADILAITKKYNKDGDLNDATVEALSGEMTPDAFKDKVLDLVAARATAKAIKPGDENPDEAGKGKDAPESEKIKGFLTAYNACKNPSDRMALIRQDRALARKARRSNNSKGGSE